MNKKELTTAINALGIKGLDFAEDTEVNNSVLEGILVLNKEKEEAEELAEELNAQNSELTERIEKLEKSGGKPVLPEVTVNKQKYVFNVPKFRLPKSDETTAKAVAERSDKDELAECIKRGVLVPVNKEV